MGSIPVTLALHPFQLTFEITDLGPFLDRRGTLGLLTGLANPIPQRRIMNIQLTRDLRDLTARLGDHRYRFSLELFRELAPRTTTIDI